MEERLSDSRQQVLMLRQGEDELQAKLSQLQNDLQRSESKSNQLELQLETSRKFLAGAKGDSSVGDNYLREELSRMKREADQFKERTREMKKTVRATESPLMNYTRGLILAFTHCITESIPVPLHQ